MMMVIYNYLQVTNFFWMLVEGLYLHTLIVWAYSTERLKFWIYALIGWGKILSIILHSLPPYVSILLLRSPRRCLSAVYANTNIARTSTRTRTRARTHTHTPCLYITLCLPTFNCAYFSIISLALRKFCIYHCQYSLHFPFYLVID